MLFIKVKKYISIFFYSILLLAVAFIVNGTIEHFYAQRRIDDFTSRGILVEETSDKYNKYYIVEAKYDYEVDDYYTFNYKNQLGTTGDILLTNRNPIPEISALKPFISFFWLGHSALVVEEYGTSIIEIVGNNNLSSNEVQISPVNGFVLEGTGEVAGVRLKSMNEEKRKQLNELLDFETDKEIDQSMKKYIGKGYSFLFGFKLTNRFYCIDLVTRMLDDIGLDLNYDFWISTGNDILVNKDSYLFYYSYVDKDGIKHTYFLD